MLSIKAGIEEPALRIEFLHELLRVPRHAGGEHDHFKVRRNGFEELVTEWALAGVHFLVHHLVRNVGDVDGEGEVRIADWLERRVHEGLIEVNHQGLFALLPQRLLFRQVAEGLNRFRVGLPLLDWSHARVLLL